MSSDSLMFSSESTSPASVRSSPLVLPSYMLDCSSGSGIGSGNHSVRTSPEMFRSPLFASPLVPSAPLLPTHNTSAMAASLPVTNDDDDDDRVASNQPPSPSSALGNTATAWLQRLFHRSSLPSGGLIPAEGGAASAPVASRSLSAVGLSEENDRDQDNNSTGGNGNGTESRSSFIDSTGLSSSQPAASTLSLSHSMSQSMIYPLSRLRAGGPFGSTFSFGGKSSGGGSTTNDSHKDDLARETSYGSSGNGFIWGGRPVDRAGGGGSVSMNDLYNMSLASNARGGIDSRGERRMIREGSGRGLWPGSGRGKNSQQPVAPPKYESLKDAIKSSFKSDKAVQKAALEARERKRLAKDRSNATVSATASISSSFVASGRGMNDSGSSVAKQDSVRGFENGSMDKEKGSGAGMPRAVASSLQPPRGSRSSSSESGGISTSSASGREPAASGSGGATHRWSANEQPTGGLTDGSPSPTPTTANSSDPEGHRREASRLTGGGDSTTPYSSHHIDNHADLASAAKGIAETPDESGLVPSTHKKLALTPGSMPPDAAPADSEGSRFGGGKAINDDDANIIINDSNPNPLNQHRPSTASTTFSPLVQNVVDGGGGYQSTSANAGAVLAVVQPIPPSSGKRRDHHHPHSHSHTPSHRTSRESLSFKSTSQLPNYSSSSSSSGPNNNGSFVSALGSTHPVSDSSHLNENDYSNSSDSDDDDSVSDDWDDHNPYQTNEFDADPTLVGAATSGSMLGIGHHHHGPAPLSMWSSTKTLLSIPVYRSLLAGI